MAGRYPVAVGIALLALSPFIVLSTALQLLETDLVADLHATRFGVQLSGGLANAGYALGAVLAADLIKRVPARWLYVGSEGVFVVGSLLCATATDVPVFTAGRTAQGLVTGMLLVAALPPLVTGYGVRRLPLTAAFVNLGLFGMVTLGPLVGGLAADARAWRWLFVAAAGLGAIGAGLGLLGFDAGDEHTPRSGFDWSAAPVAAVATVLPFVGVSWVTADGFGSPVFVVLVAVGLLALVVLLVRQYRKEQALMPLRLITHTLPMVGLGTAMVAGAAVTAFVQLTVVSLTMVDARSPLVAGAVLTTQVAGVLAAAVLFARVLTTRWLPVLALGGLGVVVVGGALLLLSDRPSLLVVAGAGVLIGFGAGAGVSPALFMAGLSAPSGRLGPTFALVELLRSEAAFLLAPVLLDAAMLDHELGRGIRLAVLVMLGLCVLVGAAMLALLLLGGAHPHAPDLERWLDGDEPAFDSPPVAAAVRDVG